MKFALDSKHMFSHLVLNNSEVANAISGTPQWKDNETLEAKLEINGVAIPAESLDELLREMWKQCQVDSGKDTFQKSVDEKARMILKEQKSKIWETINELQNKLEYCEDFIKYPWEETNNG